MHRLRVEARGMRRPTIAVLAAAALLPQPVRAAPAIQVIAHRGGAAYAPENTMAAFEHAVALGVDQLETDTQLTADGELVLVHDDTLDRTTDCTGAVIEHTFDEIASCDAAYWFVPGRGAASGAASYPLRDTGIRVPRASELFELVASLPQGTRPGIDIEIKDIPGEANFDPAGTLVAMRLVPLIASYPQLKPLVTVQSFWPPALEQVKLLDPSIRTHFLTTSSFGQTAWQNLAWTVLRGHEVSSPNFDAPDFSPAFVRAAHAAGKVVWPWTADTAADIRTVAGAGADGVISNWPACVLLETGREVPQTDLWLGSPSGRACP